MLLDGDRDVANASAEGTRVTDTKGVDEALLGFGPPVTFYLPTALGSRLEARCRAEGVVNLQGVPDLVQLAELVVREEGGGAFTIAAARRVIQGEDAGLAVLVREITRSHLLLAGHIEAAGAL